MLKDALQNLRNVHVCDRALNIREAGGENAKDFGRWAPQRDRPAAAVSIVYVNQETIWSILEINSVDQKRSLRAPFCTYWRLNIIQSPSYRLPKYLLNTLNNLSSI
jgi:hypothetical protein